MRVNLIPKLDKFGMNEKFFRFLFLIKAHNNNPIVKNKFHMIDKKYNNVENISFIQLIRKNQSLGLS